jgi:hypothetical protein
MDLSAAATSPATPRKVLAIPVPAGTSLPDLPASGIDPSTYVFTKTELQRNLVRIPLH